MWTGGLRWADSAGLLKGKRELVAFLNLSSWCLVMVERLFLAVPQGCLRFVIVVFPDHTHILFLKDWLSIVCVCVCVDALRSCKQLSVMSGRFPVLLLA